MKILVKYVIREVLRFKENQCVNSSEMILYKNSICESLSPFLSVRKIVNKVTFLLVLH